MLDLLSCFSTMAVPRVVSCSCGWVAVAETLNEAVALVEAHADRREEPTLHAITIRGSMGPKPRDDRRPSTGNAPI
jgi:hypothetical protein